MQGPKLFRIPNNEIHDAFTVWARWAVLEKIDDAFRQTFYPILDYAVDGPSSKCSAFLRDCFNRECRVLACLHGSRKSSYRCYSFHPPEDVICLRVTRFVGVCSFVRLKHQNASSYEKRRTRRSEQSSARGGVHNLFTIRFGVFSSTPKKE